MGALITDNMANLSSDLDGKTMKHIITASLITVVVLSVSSCNKYLSEGDVQTAIARTQGAKQMNTLTLTPSSTDTPVPTSTFTSTPSITPSPTITDTTTLTPTLTPDHRIIEIDPIKFLLKSDDLPKEAKYYLPDSSWISPHHNSEIISGWGTEKGREYLDRTGRVDGWWVYYKRGTQTVLSPEEIFHNIIMYKTAEGAKLTIKEYSKALDSDYKLVDRELDFGDISQAMLLKEMQPNGKYRVWYRIETAYRNYVSIVVGFGWEEEVTYDYVENIARIVIDKLEVAPLSEPID